MQKIVNHVEDIFSGHYFEDASYVAYSSASNIVGFQLNGSADGTMLDGLPGMQREPRRENGNIADLRPAVYLTQSAVQGRSSPPPILDGSRGQCCRLKAQGKKQLSGIEPSPIGVGTVHWLAPPLPPNRTGGSPASGSPVDGFYLLKD